MKFIADMHTHSIYSVDAEDTIRAMCNSAIEKGLGALCITDHIDYNPMDIGFDYFRVEDFIMETDKLKKEFSRDLILLRGIEFSEPHLYKEQLKGLSNYDFDVILGSVHWISDEFIGQRQLLELYSKEEVERRYYNIVEEAIEYGRFDVLAHLDFPKRYYGEALDSLKYTERILKLLIQKDIALEINTSSYRKGINESMPSKTIIERYVELGGCKLTLGSDAHNVLDIAGDFNRVDNELSVEAKEYIGFFIGREFKYVKSLS